jgi:hypothetical protein
MTADRALAAALLLAAVLAAGCAGLQAGAGDGRMSDREICEGSRGAGVWVEAAGACIRGGGGG